MRKETVDIIEDLLSEMDLTLKIDKITGVFGTDLVRLDMCNTGYLQECRYITLDDKDYFIEEVKHNEYIIIKGDGEPIGAKEFQPYPYHYFHGKAVETNAELDMIDDSDLKTPLVYLVEILQDRFYPNDELVERTVDIRMFFLTTANYDEWLTNEHYDKAIKPMRNLVYKFIETLDKSKIIGRFAEYYDLINHAKFGIFILRKGATNRIFDDNYSGVEFKMRLPILKDLTCSNDC
jgi:hypothetical protein